MTFSERLAIKQAEMLQKKEERIAKFKARQAAAAVKRAERAEAKAEARKIRKSKPIKLPLCKKLVLPDKPPQEFTSARTSLLNHMPALFKKIQFRMDTLNLDLGAGRTDRPTEFLGTLGVKTYCYDPYNRTAEENDKSMALIRTGCFDTVTCSNVLNVIKDDDVRAWAIRLAMIALHPGGMAYFTCYAGDGSGEGGPTNKGQCWQNNRTLATYVSEVRQQFPDAEIRDGIICAHKPRRHYPVAVDSLLIWRPKIDVLTMETAPVKTREAMAEPGTPMLYTVKEVFSQEEAAARELERQEAYKRALAREQEVEREHQEELARLQPTTF